MAKVKLEGDLYQRAAEHASAKGYSSVDEFIAHAVEEALRQAEDQLSAQDEAAIADRLRGLGYIE